MRIIGAVISMRNPMNYECCGKPANFLNLTAERAETTVGLSLHPTESASSSTSSSTQISNSISISSIASGNGKLSTTTVSVDPSATPPPKPIDSANNDIKIGLGVGIPLGLALIAALAYILYHKKRRIPVNNIHPQNLNIELPGNEKTVTGKYELPQPEPQPLPELLGQRATLEPGELHGQAIATGYWWFDFGFWQHCHLDLYPPAYLATYA